MALVAAALAVLAAGCSFGSSQPDLVVSRAGVATRDDMGPVINAVQIDPVHFAGVWWDRSAPLPLHAAFVGDDPSFRAGVEEWLPPGGSLAWHRVRYSYAELQGIQEEVLAWAGRTHDFIHSGTDVVRNMVSVGVERHDPEFEADLIERFPGGVEFIVGPRPEPL